jgi:hypothetical protein
MHQRLVLSPHLEFSDEGHGILVLKRRKFLRWRHFSCVTVFPPLGRHGVDPSQIPEALCISLSPPAIG